jgi:hypothetical protein
LSPISLRNDFRNDPILESAYEYWRSKCGTRAMPRRRDIDPTEIPRLLPHIQITELLEGGNRIRYRLAGTAIVDAYGSELTGKYFDEVFSGERLHFIAVNYRLMCDEKRPVFVHPLDHAVIRGRRNRQSMSQRLELSIPGRRIYLVRTMARWQRKL